MALSTHDILTRLRWPIYFIAIGLALIPLADFALSILPLDPGNLRWRWSALGLLSGFFFTPLFAIILVAFVAAELEDRLTLRVIAILNLLVVIALLGLTALYGLDIIQLRADLPENDRLPFYMSTVRALTKYVFGIIACLWLGIAAFRTSRAERTKPGRRGDVAPLVSGVGSIGAQPANG